MLLFLQNLTTLWLLLFTSILDPTAKTETKVPFLADAIVMQRSSRQALRQVRQLRHRHRHQDHCSLSRLASSLSRDDAATKSAASAAVERLFHYYKDHPTDAATSDSASPTMWRCRTESVPYIQDQIDNILFDCDGVLYQTTSPCPGASDCIRILMNTTKTVLFVTNNAGVNRIELREKLATLLQIPELSIEQMVSSSYASAQYLQKRLLPMTTAMPTTITTKKKHATNMVPPPPPRVHVIGSSGLCEELEAVGFNVTRVADEEEAAMTRAQLAHYDFHRYHPIDALVVGHDTAMTFRKLCIADNLLLFNPQAVFVATNKDAFDIVESAIDKDDDEDDAGGIGRRRHIAGNGATVVALEYSSQRQSINVGKPSTELFELIQQQQEKDDHKNEEEATLPPRMDPSRCLFVGDRLDTDIRFAKENGMKSCLVMTGVTTAQSLIELGPDGTEEEPLPDFIIPYVGMLV